MSLQFSNKFKSETTIFKFSKGTRPSSSSLDGWTDRGMSYSEDSLTQQTLADYLSDELGWESVFAYNTEVLGPEGTLGRRTEHEWC